MTLKKDPPGIGVYRIDIKIHNLVYFSVLCQEDYGYETVWDQKRYNTVYGNQTDKVRGKTTVSSTCVCTTKTTPNLLFKYAQYNI